MASATEENTLSCDSAYDVDPTLIDRGFFLRRQRQRYWRRYTAGLKGHLSRPNSWPCTSAQWHYITPPLTQRRRERCPPPKSSGVYSTSLSVLAECSTKSTTSWSSNWQATRSLPIQSPSTRSSRPRGGSTALAPDCSFETKGREPPATRHGATRRRALMAQEALNASRACGMSVRSERRCEAKGGGWQARRGGVGASAISKSRSTCSLGCPHAGRGFAWRAAPTETPEAVLAGRPRPRARSAVPWRIRESLHFGL